MKTFKTFSSISRIGIRLLSFSTVLCGQEELRVEIWHAYCTSEAACARDRFRVGGRGGGRGVPGVARGAFLKNTILHRKISEFHDFCTVFEGRSLPGLGL